MTPQVFAAILSRLTPEQVAQAKEGLRGGAREELERFEALGRDEEKKD